MDDNYSLDNILTQMESDYDSEHLEAAQKYIAIGGTAGDLLKIIKNNPTPNPNMEGMFFFVAGQESDEATQLAWDYLLEKIQDKPDEFEPSNTSFNPRSLLPNNRYLLFSARKYLITSERIDVFLLCAKKSQEKCIELRENLLKTLDVEKDSPDDICRFNEDRIFDIRYTFEIMLKIPMEDQESQEGNLSEDEIKKFSKFNGIFPYRCCCKIAKVKNIALLLYHLWICEFFFPAMLKISPETKYLPTYEDVYLSIFGWIDNSNDEKLFPYRVDFDFSDIYKKAFSDAEIKKAKVDIMFREIMIIINSYNYNEILESPCHNGECRKCIFRQEQTGSCIYAQSREQAPSDSLITAYKAFYVFWEIERESEVWCHDIRTVIMNCCNKDFVLAIIKMYKTVVEAYLNLEDNREDLFIDMMEYLYFQQDQCRIEHSFCFSNECRHTSKSNTYLKNRFFHYFQKSAWFKYNSQEETRAYLVFDLMLDIYPDWAFDIIRGIISSGEDALLNPPCENYFHESLRNLYEKYCKRRLSKLRVEIGHSWEYLCQTICFRLYSNVITNHRCATVLPNGTIPDAACGDNMQFEKGTLYHADILIECKKSMYYAEYSSINNPVTDKYIPFCNELQYWILEKPSDFIYPNYKKVKFIFGRDLLQNENVTVEEKNEIQELLELCKMCDHFRFKSASERELITLIDYFRKDYDLQWVEQKRRKNSEEIKFVIRQYQKDGSFVCEYTDKKTASLTTGISYDAITRCLRNERPTAGGFLWRKAVQGSAAENIEVDTEDPISLAGKQIAQVDDNGEILAIFSSVSVAASETHINTKSIRDAIKGRQKSAGGYHWIILDKDGH